MNYYTYVFLLLYIYIYTTGLFLTIHSFSIIFCSRRNILTFKCGYKEEEVKAASKEADKAKRGRAVTKYFLPYSKVEDFVTSAGRKAKRVVQK